MIENRDKVPKYKGLTTNFIFMAIGFLMIIIPMTELIESDWKYAILMVGILIAVTSLVLIPFLVGRKNRYEKLLVGRGDVVSWEMDDDFFLGAAKRKKANQYTKNKGLIAIMGFFFVLIGLGFLIFAWNEGGPETFLMVMIIFAFIALCGLTFPLISYYSSLRKSKYIFVGVDCALIGTEFHVFIGDTVKFTSAEYSEKDKAIFINYKALTQTWYTPYTAEIPVPDSEAKKAKEIIYAINTKHSLKK